MEPKPSKPYFKYCLVPLCTNTTIRTPNKIFISLPENPKRRANWLKACRRDKNDISEKSKALHVCEDHFNLEEDMENYIKFKLMEGRKEMKLSVVPHIFDCQPDRKRAFGQAMSRPVAAKRVKLGLIEDAIACSSTSDVTNTNKNLTKLEIQAEDINFHNINESEVLQKTIASMDVSTQTRTQTHIKFRSKGVQVESNTKTATVSLSPIKNTSANIGTSPIKSVLLKRCVRTEYSGYESEKSVKNIKENSSDVSSCSEYSLSSEEAREHAQEQIKVFQELCLKCPLQKLKNRPRLYLGLPEYAYYTFELLEKYCKLPSNYIFLTLKKIRTGQSFLSLSDDFGTSEASASRMFSKSLPVLSKFLRKCILTPSVHSVKLNLPLAFRAHYSNVLYIIDCLEIEIEKPSDAIKQSLTWSEYKKCNTIKYLISCTPDGIINFISTGFGGRTSDATIIEHSGFLDILEFGVAVMADRGLKHIEHLLMEKKSYLIRPPSVSSHAKFTKNEVLETKRIASLRIHVERVIRRLREFSFLEPHACIDSKLIPYTDHITKIACGLSNLQACLISGK